MIPGGWAQRCMVIAAAPGAYRIMYVLDVKAGRMGRKPTEA